VASQILAGALAPQLLHDEQYNIVSRITAPQPSAAAPSEARTIKFSSFAYDRIWSIPEAALE
jgi:hypothetical protein